MSDNIYKMQRSSSEPLEKLVKDFLDKLDGGMEELIVSEIRTYGNTEVALLVFEKYYFRSGSYANLTMQITSHDSLQRALIVGSGGGEGLLNITMGVNANFAKKAVKKLIEMGFEEKK